MKKSVDIINQPVISITEGKQVGQVKELLINSVNSSVAALVVDDGKWYLGAKLLPFSAIAGLGECAVTINNSSDILVVTDKPEFEKLFEAGIKIIGTKVLSKGGKIQGQVNELLIDTAGKINFCEIEKTNGEIINFPAGNIITFGKEVIIIAEEGEAVAAKPEVKPTNASPGQPVQAKAAVDMSVLHAAVSGAAPVMESKEISDDPAEQRKFLLGKKVARRITTDNGALIVDRGGEITEEVLQKAKLAGKFNELAKAPLI